MLTCGTLFLFLCLYNLKWSSVFDSFMYSFVSKGCSCHPLHYHTQWTYPVVNMIANTFYLSWSLIMEVEKKVVLCRPCWFYSKYKQVTDALWVLTLINLTWKWWSVLETHRLYFCPSIKPLVFMTMRILLKKTLSRTLIYSLGVPKIAKAYSKWPSY